MEITDLMTTNNDKDVLVNNIERLDSGFFIKYISNSVKSSAIFMDITGPKGFTVVSIKSDNETIDVVFPCIIINLDLALKEACTVLVDNNIESNIIVDDTVNKYGASEDIKMIQYNNKYLYIKNSDYNITSGPSLFLN